MINVFALLPLQFAWQDASIPSVVREFSLRQLLLQWPVLLVYVAALIVALVFFKRCPPASVCAMIGFVLLLAVSTELVFVQSYYYVARVEHWTDAELDRALMISNIAANVIRAAAFILILVAIFIRRSPGAASKGADYGTVRMK